VICGRVWSDLTGSSLRAAEEEARLAGGIVAFLRGVWSVERQLIDRCGVRGSLTGQAGFLVTDGPAPNSPAFVPGG